MTDEAAFKDLREYLSKVPGIDHRLGYGFFDDGRWWVKFAIDIQHPLAWQVVQELGHVLNYLSPKERLPTVFMPVSPPPYLNGGPLAFLSWVIECKDRDFAPKKCAEWLEGRLPQPVDDMDQWSHDRDENSDAPAPKPGG